MIRINARFPGARVTYCMQSATKTNVIEVTRAGKTRKWSVFTRALLGAGLGLGAVAVSAPAHAQYAGHVRPYVVDVNSGAVLSQVDPALQRSPASLTKLMTLYMAFRPMRPGEGLSPWG